MTDRIRVEKTQLGVQVPETYIAEINGRETVIYTAQDGTRSASISYEYCEPLSWNKDKVKCDREIIGVKF